jgi:hypothetical protein
VRENRHHGKGRGEVKLFTPSILFENNIPKAYAATKAFHTILVENILFGIFLNTPSNEAKNLLFISFFLSLCKLQTSGEIIQKHRPGLGHKGRSRS